MKKWKTKSGYEIILLLSGRSNVFLLSNGKSNILIDTSVARLWARLQKQLSRLNIDTIDYLILTHAHFDHAANTKRVKEKYNSKVVIQCLEEGYLSRGENNLPNGTTMLTKIIVRLIGNRLINRLRYEPCVPDILVDTEYSLEEFGFNAYLMHTPGHTIGSMSLIIDDEIAIVGDTLFGVFRWSVFPPYAVDEDLMIKSWGKLLRTKCSSFLPSHGTENSKLLVQKEYDSRIKKLRCTAG